ncbi:MAG: SRPBCC family protein [Armatimonadetes bacterium]|nr:SRPBCC family protein [Armatimonadota bacterium]
MPRIESSVLINGDVEKTYALAKNVEAFPEFMPDVKSVTILERSGDGRNLVTEFVGIIKEFKATIKWVEEDEWDDQAKTCRFKLRKGDFKSYSGIWTFESADGGTKFTSVIDFEYDIPMLGPLLKTLVARKMQQNIDGMLAAIKKQVESG